MNAAEKRIELRDYQKHVFETALKENVIAIGNTGIGKTLIAIKLLEEQNYQSSTDSFDGSLTLKNAIFLAPTQQLTYQIAGKIIKADAHGYFGPDKVRKRLRVSPCCGKKTESWSQRQWTDALNRYHVLVSTPEILNTLLTRGYTAMKRINLLIFDECHHTRKRHPYNLIMQFYKPMLKDEMPRIFGTTSCPTAECSKNMHSRPISIQQHREGTMKEDKTPVVVDFYSYNTVLNVCNEDEVGDESQADIDDVPYIFNRIRSGIASSEDIKSFLLGKNYRNIDFKLKIKEYADIKLKRIDSTNNGEGSNLESFFNMCLSVYDCLGAWCFLRYIELYLSFLQKSHITIGIVENQNSNHGQKLEKLEVYCKEMRARVDCKTDSSSKLQLLFESFSKYFDDESNHKALIFLQRRIDCRLVSECLKEMNKSISISCVLGRPGTSDVAANGIQSHVGTIKRFEKGEIRVLVTTSVSSEGIDFPLCSLVIAADEISNPRQFIQIRGRVRHKNGVMVYLLPESKEGSYEITCKEIDEIDNQQLSFNSTSIPSNQTVLTKQDLSIYRIEIPTSGASMDLGSSVSCLHQFCQSIPGFENYDLNPTFSTSEHAESKYIVKVNLPQCLNIPPIESDLMSTKQDAKALACLRACDHLVKLNLMDEHFCSIFRKEGSMKLQFADLNLPEISTTSEYTIDPPMADILGMNRISFILNTSEEVDPEIYIYRFEENKHLGILTTRALKQLNSSMGPYKTARIDNYQPTTLSIHSSQLIKITKKRLRQLWKYHLILNHLILHGFEKAESIQHQCKEIALEEIVKTAWDRGYLYVPLINDKMNSKDDVIDWKHVDIVVDSSLKNSEWCQATTNVDIDNFIFISKERNNSLFLSEGWSERQLEENIKQHEEEYLEKKKKRKISSNERVLGRWYRHEEICQGNPKQNLLCVRQIFSSKFFISFAFDPTFQQKEAAIKHRYLIPEYTDILTISKLLYYECLQLYSICFEMEQDAKLFYLRDLIGVDIDKKYLQLATEKLKYERMELLGDTFLKLEATWFLYDIKKKIHLEGILSMMRNEIVCNTRLCSFMENKQLQHFLSHSILIRKNPWTYWKPTSIGPITSFKVPFKVIADMLEALIGAYVIGSGEIGARKFLTWIGIPTLKQEQFYQRSYYPQCLPQPISFNSSSLTFSKLYQLHDVEETILRHAIELQNQLKYTFQNPYLLLQAISHPTFTNLKLNHNKKEKIWLDYQRLEFFGDALIEYLVVTYGYHYHPEWEAGDLSKWKASCVSNVTLGSIGISCFHLHHCVLHAMHLDASVQRVVEDIEYLIEQKHFEKINQLKVPKFFADCFEALVAAVFIDCQFDLHIIRDVFLSPLLNHRLEKNSIQNLY